MNLIQVIIRLASCQSRKLSQSIIEYPVVIKFINISLAEAV